MFYTTLKATFIGTHGSRGLQKGKRYKIVLSHGSYAGLYAVWVTVFTKRGAKSFPYLNGREKENWRIEHVIQ